ncbi:MAG: hypothetical protein JWO46_3508 [Nocardioidaceae bacterium]|nr:hypothetical protein [Nocardioidaceae bacterium]
MGFEGVGQVAAIILSRPQVVVVLLLGSALLVPLASSWARWLGWSAARATYAALAGIGLALVLATTLARWSPELVLSLGRRCLTDSGGSLDSPEAWLNLVLFGPVAFFGVLAVRRLLAVGVGLAALSAAIEAVQLVTGAGICQTADLQRNVAGIVVAAVTARLLVATGDVLTSGRDDPAPGHDPTSAHRDEPARTAPAAR